MRSVFLTVFTHIRHMAVHAGDAVLGMHTRRPHLEVRMLSFQHLRLGVGMYPVLLEAARLTGLIELELILRFETIVKRMVDAAVFLREVVLVVALSADIGALDRHAVPSSRGHGNSSSQTTGQTG